MRFFAILLLAVLATDRSSLSQELIEHQPESIDDVSITSDKIWLAPIRTESISTWDQPASQIISGTIIDIDRQSLRFRHEGNSVVETIPSDQVEAIEFKWSDDSGSKADQQSKAGNFSETINTAKSAIAGGKLPRWQQRCLAIFIVDSLTMLKQPAAAAKVFVSLHKESPPAFLYDSLPLNWSASPSDPTLVQLGRQWIPHDPAMPEQTIIERLCAGSWLLGTDEDATAKDILQTIAKDRSDPLLASIAKRQLWRTATPIDIRNNYASWAVERDRLIPPLQIGPTICLATKLDRANMKDESIQEWLNVEVLTKKKPHFQLPSNR